MAPTITTPVSLRDPVRQYNPESEFEIKGKNGNKNLILVDYVDVILLRYNTNETVWSTCAKVGKDSHRRR